MRRFKSIVAFAALTAVGLWSGSQAAAQSELPQPRENAPPPGEAGQDVPNTEANLPQDYEVLARGPLHEAFASPFVSNPTPSEIVREQPPEPINEVPPGEMPAGEGIVWIPGYWGWEPAEDAFVWISGLWREAPPNRRWVPGYWTKAEGGFQWIAGFWAEASESQIAYLPEPPPPQSNGPNMRPPSQDSVWLPGSWIWRDGDYEWRPGYWTPVAPGWVWIPDQYLWTPHGYIFVAGYWDRPFDERGVMFAPVVYEEPIYTQPNYTYVPETVVNTAPLLMHLFASPAYSHYYYGDYYGFQPQGTAFFPWYTYSRRTALYDPLLTYYQWSYATRGVDLARRLSGWNGFFASNEQFRPPRTFRAQRQFVSAIDVDNAPIDVSSVVLTDTFQDVLRSNSTGVRFTPVADDRREFLRNASQDMRQFQQQRRDFEQAVAQRSGNQATNNQQPIASGNQNNARQENAFQLPDNPFRGANENPAVAGPDRAGDDDNPATADDTPANQEDPATARENQPGQRRGGPPARPEPIQRHNEDAPATGDEPGANRPNQPGAPGSDRTDNPATAPDQSNQPGAPGAEDRTVNPATATDQPDSPNATDRPEAPNATDRPEAPNAAGRSDNPATPEANRPGAAESGEMDQNQESRFPRFGVAPQDNDTQNQPGAESPNNAASPNGPGANRPGFVPQGRGRLRPNDPLNRLPPGMDRPNVPGRNNPAAQGQRPQNNPEMRSPNRGTNPGAAQRAPRPQQPGASAPNPAAPQPRQQRPNPAAPNPGAAGQGGNPAQSQSPSAAGGGGTGGAAQK